jgi:hypothetical protein
MRAQQVAEGGKIAAEHCSHRTSRFEAECLRKMVLYGFSTTESHPERINGILVSRGQGRNGRAMEADQAGLPETGEK